MASFNIKYPGSANDFVVSANKALQTKGGVFTGNQQSGTFSIKTLIGLVTGKYQVLPSSSPETQVAITILQKPMLVPMSKIQSVIQGYF